MPEKIKLEDYYDLEALHKKLQENSRPTTLHLEQLTKIASDALFEAKASGLGLEKAYEIAENKLKGVTK